MSESCLNYLGWVIIIDVILFKQSHLSCICKIWWYNPTVKRFRKVLTGTRKEKMLLERLPLTLAPFFCLLLFFYLYVSVKSWRSNYIFFFTLLWLLWLFSCFPFNTLPFPLFSQQKCMRFNPDATVWVAKQRILCTLNQSLKDVLNYGLFQPASGGRDGKFLDEERILREYPQPISKGVPCLEVHCWSLLSKVTLMNSVKTYRKLASGFCCNKKRSKPHAPKIISMEID